MSDWENETGGSAAAAFTVLPDEIEPQRVRGDRVRFDDVLYLHGVRYTVVGIHDVEGRGKVTGISLTLKDRDGGRRSHNVGAAATVEVYR